MAIANATNAQVNVARAKVTAVLHSLTVVNQYGKPRSTEAGTAVNTAVTDAITALQAIASA